MSRTTTIIKADTEFTGRWGMASFELSDVLEEAQKTLADARQKSAAIIKAAQDQAEAVQESARKRGYDRGFGQGQQAGLQAGHKEAFDKASKEFAEQQKTLIAACEQIYSQINDRRIEWQAAARQDLVELAMVIARRVVHAVGQRERDTVLANLEEAIRLTGQRSEITIHVNPKDAATAHQFADSLVNARSQWQHVNVVEDGQVLPGGCRIQWSNGCVDADLETQLKRIESELSTAKVDG